MTVKKNGRTPMPRRGFGGLITDSQWQHLTESLTPRRFTAGQTLLRQGDSGAAVHLIVSGSAQVVSVGVDGTVFPLAFRARGEILGEPVLTEADAPRAATVTALTDGSTVCFPVERFRRRISELRLDSVLLRSVLLRRDESDRLRMQQATLTAERLLPAALVQLASMLGEPAATARLGEPGLNSTAHPLRIGLSQHEVAEFVGLRRTSTNQAYAELKKKRLIQIDRGCVSILDLPALEALACGSATE